MLLASFVRNGGSCRAAWLEAVRHVAGMRNRSAARPDKALRPVLAAWLAWSCSTSGVEQDFATMQGLLPKQCQGLSDARVEDLLVVCKHEATEEQKRRLIAQAQDLWLQFYGRSRQAQEGQVRFRRPVALKCTRGGLETEASWLRKRRSAVLAAARKWQRAGRDRQAAQVLQAQTDPAWTDKMEKESVFQAKKRFKRLVRAHDSGLALPQDLGDQATFAREKAKVQKRTEADMRKHARKHQRKITAKTLQRPAFVRPEGPVFIDAQLVGAARAAVVQHVAPAALTDVREDAKHFVVRTVSQPGQRVQWLLALRGGCVSDPAWLASKGRRGLHLTYKSGVQTARRVWVSPTWAERHSRLYDIISAAIQTLGSRWSFFNGSVEEYVRAARAAGSSRPIFGLVTPGDQAASQARVLKKLAGHVY